MQERTENRLTSPSSLAVDSDGAEAGSASPFPGEAITQTSPTLLTAPGWAAAVEEYASGLRWSVERTVEIASDTADDRELVPLVISASVTHALVGEPGGPLTVNRGDVAVMVGGELMTPAQGRELARALNGILDAVEEASGGEHRDDDAAALRRMMADTPVTSLPEAPPCDPRCEDHARTPDARMGWDWTDGHGYAAKTCRWSSRATTDGQTVARAERFANRDAVTGQVEVYEPRVSLNDTEYVPEQAAEIGHLLAVVAEATR